MDIRNFFTKKRPLTDDDPHTSDLNREFTSGEPCHDDSHMTDINRASTSKGPGQPNQRVKVLNSSALESEVLDLPKKGEPMKQIFLREYPKQSNGRSFHACWLNTFKWLEYSAAKDAAFCYACRQFQPFSN